MERIIAIVNPGTDSEHRAVVQGRDAWALKQLVQAGSRGLTAYENPAPRWSHYIMKLRRAGVPIETIEEHHGGEFAGTHGRYRLMASIQIFNDAGSV